MKITKTQLKKIIKEELLGITKSRRHNRPVVISRQEFQTLREHKIPIPRSVLVEGQRLNEVAPVAPVVAAGGATVARSAAKVGKELLMAMLATPEGRNKLADMLVAIPELQSGICDVWNAPTAIAGAAETAVVGEPGAISQGASSISMVGKKLCKWGFKALAAPIYLLAYILRQMSDEEAEAVATASQVDTIPAEAEEITQGG
jgi:hypothetical protein